MTPHWHDVNPWRDQIVYACRLRPACRRHPEGGTISIGLTGRTVPYDTAFILKHWRSMRTRPARRLHPAATGRCQALCWRSLWAPTAVSTLSPHNAHPDRIEALLEEYRDTNTPT